MHREQVLWLAAIVAEFLTELDDDLVERAGGALVVVAPDLVQQAVAGHDFAGVRVEELQEF